MSVQVNRVRLGDIVVWHDNNNQRREGLVLKVSERTDSVQVAPRRVEGYIDGYWVQQPIWVDTALLFLPA